MSLQNPIKLQLCSCCFNLIETWTERAFPFGAASSEKPDNSFRSGISAFNCAFQSYQKSIFTVCCVPLVWQLRSIPTALTFEGLAGPSGSCLASSDETIRALLSSHTGKLSPSGSAKSTVGERREPGGANVSH